MKRPERRVRAANHAGQRARSVLVAQGRQSLCDVVKRLIPTHLLPFATASFPHAVNRIIDPPRAVENIEIHLPTATPCKDSLVIWVPGRIWLKVDNAPVLDSGEERAAISAEMAVCRFSFDHVHPATNKLTRSAPCNPSCSHAQLLHHRRGSAASCSC